MRTIVAQFFAVALAFAGAGIILAAMPSAPAHGDVLGIETSQHGVVRSSSLPHCTTEDGSGSPLPCTWNIGDDVDGNGRGLAYIVRADGSTDYVWAHSPARNGWHWSNVDADCVVKAGHYRCPDGAVGVN